MDDIIIYGSTETEHDQSLNEVLKKLKENNVKLNEAKCVKKVQQLNFLGHHLSANGIDADTEKVKAILGFRQQNSKEELRSFLGMVSYLGKLIPDLGSTTEPLRQLTKRDAKFLWSVEHKARFDKLKDALAKLPTFTYFDPSKRTRLIGDASPVALGAVLLQFDDRQTPK